MKKAYQFGYIFGAIAFAITAIVLGSQGLPAGAVISVFTSLAILFGWMVHHGEIEKEDRKKNTVSLRCKVIKKYIHNHSRGYFIIESAEPTLQVKRITIPVHFQTYHMFEPGDYTDIFFVKNGDIYTPVQNWD